MVDTRNGPIRIDLHNSARAGRQRVLTTFPTRR